MNIASRDVIVHLHVPCDACGSYAEDRARTNEHTCCEALKIDSFHVSPCERLDSGETERIQRP